MNTFKALDEHNQAFLDDWSISFKRKSFKLNFIFGLIAILSLATLGYMAVIALS